MLGPGSLSQPDSSCPPCSVISQQYCSFNVGREQLSHPCHGELLVSELAQPTGTKSLQARIMELREMKTGNYLPKNVYPHIQQCKQCQGSSLSWNPSINPRFTLPCPKYTQKQPSSELFLTMFHFERQPMTYFNKRVHFNLPPKE